MQIAPEEAALDAFPASPLHIAIPAGAVAGHGLPARLEAALGDAAAAHAERADGSRVSIAHAWALNRARLAGGSPADYGDVRRLPARAVRGAGVRTWRVAGARRAGVPPPRGSTRAVLARVWAEARHIRGARTLWRFLRWLCAATRWRLGQGRG